MRSWGLFCQCPSNLGDAKTTRGTLPLPGLLAQLLGVQGRPGRRRESLAHFRYRLVGLPYVSRVLAEVNNVVQRVCVFTDCIA